MLQHQSEDESFMRCYYLCTCACVSAFCQMTLIANAMWLSTPARLARCGINTRKQHARAHTHAHCLVHCVALAGTNTSISIWKTAAGRCSCHWCCLLFVFSIWRAAPLLLLTFAITLAMTLPLCVSISLSLTWFVLILPPCDSCLANQNPSGI